jgi:hypothetical protein
LKYYKKADTVVVFSTRNPLNGYTPYTADNGGNDDPGVGRNPNGYASVADLNPKASKFNEGDKVSFNGVVNPYTGSFTSLGQASQWGIPVWGTSPRSIEEVKYGQDGIYYYRIGKNKWYTAG